MSYSLDYRGQRIAAEASGDARAGFIRRSYGHLAGALLAFAIIETLLMIQLYAGRPNARLCLLQPSQPHHSVG